MILLYVFMTLGGLMMGISGIAKLLAPPRFLEVKGVAERIIPATVGFYSIPFHDEAPTLEAAKQKSKESMQKVMAWLDQQKIAEKEISSLSSARLNHSDKKSDFFRVVTRVFISSEDVQKIKNLEENSAQLLEKNVMLGTGEDATYPITNVADYEIRNLEALRPGLLEEAIKSAGGLAQKLAQDLDVKVGAVQEATFTSFDVMDYPQSGRWVGSAMGSWQKKVSVTATVKYAIKL